MERNYEAERREHVRKYGSFLFCPKRETICSYMEQKWKTGEDCSRTPCILDDPINIKLQKTIEQNRKMNQITEEKPQKNIRNQSSQCTSYVQRKRVEIRRLEEESKIAFRRNNPNKGHTLFNEAMIMRQELKKYIEGKENNA